MPTEPPSPPKGATRKAVRIFRLGHEPRDDLRAGTTAEERLYILRRLSERAWALSGRNPPVYSRSEMPVRIVPLV